MIYPKDNNEWEEGKALAQELMRHGVKNLAIAKALDVTQSCVSQWRKQARRKGRKKGAVEIYEDPRDLERKMKELERYRGIYAPERMQELAQQRMQDAEKLFRQGATIKQVCQELHISVATATCYKRELGLVATDKKEKELSNEAWVQEFREEWDEFMGRLARPIRLAGNGNEQ